MKKRIQFFGIIIIIILVITTLCIDDSGKGGNDNKPKGKWQDLTHFNMFLEENFLVTEKEETGSKVIKDIPEPEKTTYIAVGIDQPFTNLEAEALHNYFELGGNLIIASDNSSNVNPLAKLFGVVYIDHHVLDLGFDYNYTFVPLFAETTNNSFQIIVHSPMGLDIPNYNFRIIAQSEESPDKVLTALDINDNIKIDAYDRPGPIPIIVEISTKDSGKAVFISDASMFSDNLWKLHSKSDKFPARIYENLEFISDLISTMYDGDGLIIYDTSKQTDGFSNFRPYPTE